jgi:hypothetical protein
MIEQNILNTQGPTHDTHYQLKGFSNCKERLKNQNIMDAAIYSGMEQH